MLSCEHFCEKNVKKEKSAINLDNLGEFCQIRPRAINLLGRSVASKMIYVRRVAGPENKWENPNIKKKKLA